jgi:hypothetical protein
VTTLAIPRAARRPAARRGRETVPGAAPLDEPWHDERLRALTLRARAVRRDLAVLRARLASPG